MIPIGREVAGKPPGKVPWLTGQTGYEGEDADPAEFDTWPGRIAGMTANGIGGTLNLGVRFPVGVLGIDVDAYDGKRGLVTLAEREALWGALPDTYRITARRYDGGSGIRLYRVAQDYQGPGALIADDGSDGHIDLIDRWHRLAAVPPSIHHTGARYRLYGPHGDEITPGVLPLPDELPELGTAWQVGLAALVSERGTDHRGNGHRGGWGSHADVSRALAEWADNDYPHGLGQVLTGLDNRLADGTNRHTAMFSALCWAFKEARAGGYPAREAYESLNKQWLNMSRDSDDGRHNVAEFDRMAGDAIARALTDDIDKRRLRMRRNYGTHHRDEANTGNIVGIQSRLRTESTTVEGDGANKVEPSPAGGPQFQAGQKATRRRHTPVDLRRLRTEPRTPVVWLFPDVIPHDSYVSLSAAPGTGKSILARGIGVDASLGRSHTDHAEALDPARVIYLDAENGEDWWRDDLDKMAAPLDLPNLSVVCFPDLAGLDTAKGAREFHDLIADLSADLSGVDLVVLDTVSRFIEGGENDADTWSQFYRLAIQPLREQKIAVLRLDHLGKDADRGPRGSSHKLADVDADYRLTADRPGSDELTLTLGKRRRQHFAEKLRLRRVDGPLRHELRAGALGVTLTTANGSAVPVNPDVAALVTELDRVGVDPTLGRDRARREFKAGGGRLTASAAIWSAAVKFRRNRATTLTPTGGQTP